MQIPQEQIEIIIANATRPRSNSNFQYPLNDLDDRLFEILTYSIFKMRLANNDVKLVNRYEDVILMQGVREKGMDCMLIGEGEVKGIIQCKKYASNLSDKQILSELIKFSLHIVTGSLSVSNDFTYMMGTSTGYTGKALSLPTMLKKGTFIGQYNIGTITSNIIDKYKEFSDVSFDDIESALTEIIKKFNYQFIQPQDYTLWINDYPNIIETFFEIKKVTDNILLEKKSKDILDAINELFPKNETDNIKEFLEIYKKVAKEKLNVVNFIGFDIQRHRQRPTDIALTDLYVHPSFSQRTVDKNEKIVSAVNRELTIANIFKSEKNLVILGHPGAGKSLLVKFLIVQLLEGKLDTIGIKQFSNYLPWRIELRKYNEARESKNIIEHLVDVLAKEYHIRISSLQLEKIFDNTLTIIFFDGLDEIFNVTHKAAMKESIEVFSSRFPLSKCVVTSRFIGYHDIKFNSGQFDEFAISNLDEPKVKQLVDRFYATQYNSPEKRKVYSDNCIRQLDEDVDVELKSNPLILTLILILASNNIIIPESKLEIYEACTKTLVDSIDLKEKELKIEIPVKNKNLVFAHLAYWQYEQMTKNIEVSYEGAVKSISGLLIGKGEVDYSEAEITARVFLEYAERRSIYFENNFTHKTFLEYFTAEYLFANCIAKANDNGRKKLIDTVITYLPNSFWYIVFELLFTRIDKFQPDNELLDEVLGRQLESKSIDVFYFLIGNLTRFNNVSISIKRQIIKETILLCVKGERLKEEIGSGTPFMENSLLFKLALLEDNADLLTLLQDVFDELENERLLEKRKIDLYNLFFEIKWVRERKKTNSQTTLTYKNNLAAETLALKDLLLFSNIYISLKTVNNEKLPVSTLITQIENFGIKSLFTNVPMRYTENVMRVPTFDIYIISIIESLDYDGLKKDLKILSESGLNFESILKHIRSNKILYFIRSSSLEKILNLYLKSDDERVDELLLNMVRSDNEFKVAYTKYREKNSDSKLKAVDKLFDKKVKVSR